MDGGKMVNAVKFYVRFDRVGCVLFKVFTVYLLSGFHAPRLGWLDGTFTEKIHAFYLTAPRSQKLPAFPPFLSAGDKKGPIF
jgi:hypothetical protein